jgi:purine-binding chemotaxis protein CheW
MTTMMSTNSARQLCTFTIDQMLFGVDVMNVQEVIRYQEMTRVPLAGPSVRGLINLRGQIVTAIEMRARLGLRPRGADVLPMNVVTMTPNGGIVSFLVDEIGDVIEVEEHTYESAPETMPASFRRFVRGVFKLEGRLLLLLDAENVAALGGGSSDSASTTAGNSNSTREK